MNKNLLLNFAMLIVSLLLSLGLAELTTRVYMPQQLVRAYAKSDPYLGNVGKPNRLFRDVSPYYQYWVKTNNLGLRMNDNVDLNSSTSHLIFLGDSSTFGWGVDVEKSYAALLRNSLNQNQDSNLEIINAGWGGYSTGHIIKTLEKIAALVPVSKAVYFMNSNDLGENINQNENYRVYSYRKTFDKNIVVAEELVYSRYKRFLLLKTPYEWLNQHSHLFILVKRLFHKKTSVSDGPPSFTLNPELLKSDTMGLMQDVSLELMKKLISVAQSKDISMMVVWLPSESELSSGHDEERKHFEDFKSKLKYLALRDSVVFFDPTEKFKQFMQHNNYHIDQLRFTCGHFNETGNQLFFESVYDAINNFVVNEKV